MILANLSKAISAQNYYAVFLEFLIVILGVVVGFQVTAWNEERSDRRSEIQYYNEIILDLQEDLATAELVSRVSDRNSTFNNEVVAALNGDEQGYSGSSELAISFIRAGYGFVPRTARSTFDELTSTGNIVLLTNDELRREIRNYYSRMEQMRQWDDSLRQIQSEYNMAINGVVDRRVWQMDSSNELPDLSETDIRNMIEVARQRPELRGLLDQMANIQIRFSRDADNMAQAAEELISSIEAELIR